MKYLKPLIVAVLLVTGTISIVLFYLTANQYSPEDLMKLDTISSGVLDMDDEISIFTWNIGYAGMDRGASSYTDGGRQLSTSELAVANNLDEIGKLLKRMNSDIFLLQEVDKDSDRTFHIDQEEKLSLGLDGYFKTYTYDYKIDFYPLPLDKMMGKIHSGFLTMGKVAPDEVLRYRIIKEESWPASVFSKDECVLVWEYKLVNGKKLVVYNINMSGYEKLESLMKGLNFIRGMLLEDYLAGNYAVAGGDWGITLPGYVKQDLESKCGLLSFSEKINDDWTPAGWNWAYPYDYPSVRSASTPYGSETCLSTVDGFLVSPNLSVTNINSFGLLFENSDHNPLEITVKFN